MTDLKANDALHIERPPVYSGDDKLRPIETINSTLDEELAKRGPSEQLDYSGAHEKTDPAEIALVKKLDWYIMPMSVNAILFGFANMC